jgi:hypothetical protein
MRPDEPRPFRLPTIAKWGALGVFIIWMAIYFFGGWNSPKIILADPHQGPGLYLLGLLIVALYAPLYWWRAWQDRRLAAAGRLPAQPALAVAGATPLGDEPALRAEDGTADDSARARTDDPVTEAGPPAGEPPAVR